MTKTPTFEDFWKEYPVHKSKKEAERAWSRLSAKDKRDAIAALPSYREACKKACVAFKYPQGWLNGRRWEDEADEPQDSLQAKRASSMTGFKIQGSSVEAEQPTQPPVLDEMTLW